MSGQRKIKVLPQTQNCATCKEYYKSDIKYN
jgi:hypothetical protein